MNQFRNSLLLTFVFAFGFGNFVHAQSSGNSISGTVVDPSGAAIPKATVEIHNPVSGYDQSTTTSDTGSFSFANVPFNPYHLSVTADGFAPYAQDIEVRSSVPLNVKISLSLAGTTSSVTVEAAGDLIEVDPTAHTDVDRELFNDVPLESASSSVSSIVTLATPGVSADSNGMFHGMGDHAENSFSVDGQPITDQQSKTFSNQIPSDSIQSMEVIEGAPPAEYGDKTSLVINVTTRSGQGVTPPHGSVTTSYGSFGSPSGAFDLAYGGPKWGNFISLTGMNSGRFLDPPELVVLHDKGNEENAFDRADYQLSQSDSLHLNLGFSRSWFQTPNTYDAQYASPWNGVVVSDEGLGPNGEVVGPADQRSQIKTFNISPTWNHQIGSNAVFTLGAYVRHDQYNYYPSSNPFADLGPTDLQRETVSQLRFLMSAGTHSDISYVKGIHNIKAGVSYEQTFVTENDNLGIVDPTFNAPCLDAGGNPLQGFTNPSLCPAGDLRNAAFNPILLPYDLTRGGGLFAFRGHTDVKELGLYVEDTITKDNWVFNLGMRGDMYNGLTTAQQAEPRLGMAYNIKKTNTVFRISYARTLETPFNENLVLSSIGCNNPVLNPLLSCSSAGVTPLNPGYRNEFHAGVQQAFGKHIVIGYEYIWKYTHNAYDFSVLGNTPITFPIEWHNAKIPGFTGHVNVTNLHGFTAYVVMSSVAARFFLPQIGGAGETPSAPGGVFRIDHDEHFNQTTHVQYQTPWKRGPWLGLNWRYDSGQVAGATPCYGTSPAPANYNDCPQAVMDNGQPAVLMETPTGNPLSADQEFEAGFYCGASHPAPPSPANPMGTFITSGLPTVGGVTACPASQFGSTLLKVPTPNTENDDKNPPRVASRNLFDLAIGQDNLFQGDRYKWSVRLTVINLTNKEALYNFLSTFSGTHYVTPRTFTGELGFHF